MAARHPHHAYDDAARPAGVVYLLMLVVALAFGGFIWQLFSPPEADRIQPPSASYKTPPPASATTAPDEAETGVADGAEAPAEVSAPDVVEAGPPALGERPLFVENGAFVAQLAALQSQAAVDPAWRRLASRAPELFEDARLDIERADLGARGVYYRVRVGYFADRANAARFCQRMRQMGQDCIVATR